MGLQAQLKYICRQENDSLSGNTDQNEPMKQAEIAIAESLTFSSQNAINFKVITSNASV